MGVSQNYHKALHFFRQGIKKDSHACYYKLAECYMMGYGVERDTAKANTYLQTYMEKAAEKQSENARENFRYLDSLKHWTEKPLEYWTDGRSQRIGNSKEEISNTATMQQLQGEWEGQAYIYDWSGKTIHQERTLYLHIKTDGTILDIEWKNSSEDQKPPHYSGMKNTKKGWESVRTNSKRGQEIQSAKFEIKYIDEVPVLYIDFFLINPKNKENRPPIMAVLEKIILIT